MRTNALLNGILLILATAGVAEAAVWYVDASATSGTNSGVGWGDAFLDLQDAITLAGPGDKIRVAAGMYFPDRGTGNRSERFSLHDGVNIAGGYPTGGGTSRYPSAYRTILSGDIGTPIDPSDNSYTVVHTTGTGPSAVLDGFTITAGNANGAGANERGGGMIVNDASPTIRNCRFVVNSAASHAGGMHIQQLSAPMIIGCTFQENGCGADGGGMHVITGSSPTLINCQFISNSANRGGGMANKSALSTLQNCVFHANFALQGGGVFNNNTDPARFVNCTFNLNNANVGTAGGMYNTPSAETEIANCIFWNNVDSGGSASLAQINDTSQATVSHSCIEGGVLPGPNNISVAPQFLDYAAGDLRLRFYSPCLDRGDAMAVLPDLADLNVDGNTTHPTPFDVRGARYPRFADVPYVANTGNGIPPTLDLGAYERRTFFKGFGHLPMGSATWEPPNPNLVVQSAAAGEFGASIDLGETDYGKVRLRLPSSTSLPNGSAVVVRAYEDLDAPSPAYGAELGLEIDDSHFVVRADLANLSPDSLRVELSLEGVLVQSSTTMGSVPPAIEIETWIEEAPPGDPDSCDVIINPCFKQSEEHASEIEFPAVQMARVVGNPFVEIDRIVIYAENAVLPENMAVERLDVVGSGMDDFTIVDEAIGLFGLVHRALGEAHMLGGQEGEELTVDNIGPDQLSGLHVELDISNGYLMETTPLDLSTSGASFEVGAAGHVQGAAPTDVGSVRLFNTLQDTIGVEADFSPSGAADVLVEIYDDGDFVGSALVAPGSIGSLSAGPAGPAAIVGLEVLSPGDATLTGLAISANRDFAFTPEAPSPGFVGDEIRLIAHEGQIDLVTDLFINATGIGQIIITDENVTTGEMPCATHADCADLDGDGIRDDACVWWECDAGACAGTDVSFADVGGPNGDCHPDGTVDGNDRFHILNCFSNQDTQGAFGYPCEANPPAAFNVDAGGPLLDCEPDSVCDGNDVFHVLNTFEGSSACGCGSGPAPQVVPPPTTASATMLLVAAAHRIEPGELIEVQVYVANPLEDLRGYQLHLGTSGGRDGSLQLVDISVTDRKDAAMPTASWQAFNVATAQMLAGLDDADTDTPPKAYLATFLLEATPDADGEFLVELRHDSSDPADRTFLFSTAPSGSIAIASSEPAVVRVEPRTGRSRVRP